MFATENAQIGFLFDQQESQLELKGTGGRKEEVADLSRPQLSRGVHLQLGRDRDVTREHAPQSSFSLGFTLCGTASRPRSC